MAAIQIQVRNFDEVHTIKIDLQPEVLAVLMHGGADGGIVDISEVVMPMLRAAYIAGYMESDPDAWETNAEDAANKKFGGE